MNNKKTAKILRTSGLILAILASVIFIVVVSVGLISYGQIFWGFEKKAMEITLIAFIAQCVFFSLAIILSVAALLIKIEESGEGANKKNKIISVVSIIVSLALLITLVSCSFTAKAKEKDNVDLFDALLDTQEELGLDLSVWLDYVIIKDSDCYLIDSNPTDSKYEYTQALGYLYVEDIITTLHENCGIPAIVWIEMGQTSALDGRQTYTYKNLTISWKYHPNSGLEVLYTEN